METRKALLILSSIVIIAIIWILLKKSKSSNTSFAPSGGSGEVDTSQFNNVLGPSNASKKEPYTSILGKKLPKRVMIIRNAENDGHILTTKGHARANCLMDYFTNIKRGVITMVVPPDIIYAIHDPENEIAYQTVLPLAGLLQIPVRTNYSNAEELANGILNDSSTYGKNILICWEYKTIPDIVKNLYPEHYSTDLGWDSSPYNHIRPELYEHCNSYDTRENFVSGKKDQNIFDVCWIFNAHDPTKFGDPSNVEFTVVGLFRIGKTKSNPEDTLCYYDAGSAARLYPC